MKPWRCGWQPSRRCFASCKSGCGKTGSRIRCSTRTASAATSKPPTPGCGRSGNAARIRAASESNKMCEVQLQADRINADAIGRSVTHPPVVTIVHTELDGLDPLVLDRKAL